ncbi:MAG: 3-oxoacyl-[acyl-carrier-protein] synthase 3 [Synergistales bacterium 54_24]|nr:MAG: 3-oxoacyl-[acyl-carrier-protein] synthase 3 [Synergistales bacterium 54_24]
MPLYQGRPVSVFGTGMYMPERVLTNYDLEKMVDTSDAWIKERTGISERRIAAQDELTSDLALKASTEALKDASISPEAIDMVLVATNTPDSIFPGVAPKVQGMLNASRAGACDIQSGCTSSVYALSMAASGIASGIWDNVLVIGAEVLSRLVNWRDRNTCVLFGDGAGAAVLGVSGDGKNRVIASSLRSDGTKHNLITFLGGLVQYPATHDTVDAGLHYIQMKGNEVFKFANRTLPSFLEDFCHDAGCPVDKIDWWVFHQANWRIIEGVLKRMDVPLEKTIVNLDKYGNTSSASVFVALHEGLQSGKIRRGDLVLTVSFGSGMTYGAILFEV